MQTGRSDTGRVRNMKAMNADKREMVTASLIGEANDAEALSKMAEAWEQNGHTYVERYLMPRLLGRLSMTVQSQNDAAFRYGTAYAS